MTSAPHPRFSMQGHILNIGDVLMWVLVLIIHASWFIVHTNKLSILYMFKIPQFGSDNRLEVYLTTMHRERKATWWELCFASVWSSILFVHRFCMKELVFMRRCKQSFILFFFQCLLIYVHEGVKRVRELECNGSKRV